MSKTTKPTERPSAALLSHTRPLDACCAICLAALALVGPPSPATARSRCWLRSRFARTTTICSPRSDQIDGRMRWSNASEITKGVYWSVLTAQETNLPANAHPDIVFITDGQEAPRARSGLSAPRPRRLAEGFDPRLVDRRRRRTRPARSRESMRKDIARVTGAPTRSSSQAPLAIPTRLKSNICPDDASRICERSRTSSVSTTRA